VTPENYKFKYQGKAAVNGRDAHVFQVTPRKKRPGLFKGEVWIDAATYLRVRESGYLVKNPSIFLKRVEFVRNYEIRDGIAVPRRVESVVETRLVGKAELTIDFTNFSVDGGMKQAAFSEAQGQ
jgi:negative regulator of sigma E activity